MGAAMGTSRKRGAATDRTSDVKRGSRALCGLLSWVAIAAMACAPVSLGPPFAPRERPHAGGELYVYRVDGEHDAVVANAKRFVPQLLRAIRSVEARIHARS